MALFFKSDLVCNSPFQVLYISLWIKGEIGVRSE